MKVQVDNVRVNEPDTVTEFLLDGGGFFLAYDDYGGKFDTSLSACTLKKCADQLMCPQWLSELR